MKVREKYKDRENTFLAANIFFRNENIFDILNEREFWCCILFSTKEREIEREKEREWDKERERKIEREWDREEREKYINNFFFISKLENSKEKYSNINKIFTPENLTILAW